MTMIVREMIVLDRECFQPTHPLEFSDDSGWLGPPRAVPFAWELAPGTPKHDHKTAGNTLPSVSPAAEAAESFTGFLTNSSEAPGREEESGRADEFGELESGRHSIHILESAPQLFLVTRSSNYHQELLGMGLSHESAVPFKWEMEPGIPRDPDKCRLFLDCPLTPPPVLHSKSMVVHSNRKSRFGLSLSERMRSLLWIHPHRSKQQDFLLRSHLVPTKSKTKILLLKDSSSSDHSTKKNSVSDDFHSDEEDLSPVSVLDYSNSIRCISTTTTTNNNNNRASSASSSIRSYYHSPKDSFSWDNAEDSPSSRRSLKSVTSSHKDQPLSSKKNSLYSLLTLKKRISNSKEQGTGCFMMLAGSNRSASFTTQSSYDEAVSEFNSSEKSSSLSDSSSTSMAAASTDELKQSRVSDSDEDARSVYYSPVPKFQSESFSFRPNNINNNSDGLKIHDSAATGEFKGFHIIERVDSLDTIDPGFAPSEIGDENYQGNFNLLNRMTSCARWQKRQPSTKSKRNGRELARSLFGRVSVCCSVPRDDEIKHE